MIEFHDVHKHFGALHVLQGITLTVAEGEVVVIIGPSGSGKSTMIRTVNRLEPIERGTLTVNGTRVDDRRTDVNKLRRDVESRLSGQRVLAARTSLRRPPAIDSAHFRQCKSRY